MASAETLPPELGPVFLSAWDPTEVLQVPQKRAHSKPGEFSLPTLKGDESTGLGGIQRTQLFPLRLAQLGPQRSGHAPSAWGTEQPALRPPRFSDSAVFLQISNLFGGSIPPLPPAWGCSQASDLSSLISGSPGPIPL